MVARIAHTRRMSSVLNYNEKKVAREKAQLIHASGFLKDKDRLNLHDKSERFQRLNELRDRTKVNMLHISLNFDPSENLTEEQLTAIADRYMEGIGFKDQPYLVYQHNDAGHPHLHIVTNIIQANGGRIDTHNIGKRLSEPTRKAIEKEFGLVRAEDSKKQQEIYQVKPLDVQKIVYGTEQETKKAMREIVKMVSDEYKFASLHEYNAVLRQYNVIADQGGKESRTYKHGGLVYRALDEQGNKVGVPIKASSFYFKPTVKNLEEKFDENKQSRKSELPNIRHRVDWSLQQNPGSLREFVEDLQKDGIELVIRQNDLGKVYGLTYVDNRTKTVINGGDLGEYSAGAILKKFDIAQAANVNQGQHQVANPGQAQPPVSTPPALGQQAQSSQPSLQIGPAKPAQSDQPQLPNVPGYNNKVPQVLSNLMRSDESFGKNPNELSEDQKIRRKILR